MLTQNDKLAIMFITNKELDMVTTATQFLEEHYERTNDPRDKMVFKELFDEYHNWCADNIVERLPKNKFRLFLKLNGFITVLAGGNQLKVTNIKAIW